MNCLQNNHPKDDSSTFFIRINGSFLFATIACVFIFYHSVAFSKTYYKFEKTWPSSAQKWVMDDSFCSPKLGDDGSVYSLNIPLKIIYKYSKSGYIIKKIHLNEKIPNIKLGQNIFLDKLHNIYVIDNFYKKGLYILSNSGDIINHIGHDILKNSIQKILGSTIDSNGNIYLAGVFNNRGKILVISSDLTYKKGNFS
jgi:hypothetical protein